VVFSRFALYGVVAGILVGATGYRAIVAADDPQSGTAEAESIHWQPSLKAAHKIAVRENKPLLLVWGADWCGFCKKLEGETLAHPALAKYINETFVAVHLDYDKDEKVRDILEVERLPCTIVLTPQAEQLERFEGFQQPADVYQKLSGARQLYLELTQTTSQTVR
jgi:uncharacterized protein YyaL (SSP411 family)